MATVQEIINQNTQQGSTGDQPFRSGASSVVVGPQESPTQAPVVSPTPPVSTSTQTSPDFTSQLRDAASQAQSIQAGINNLPQQEETVGQSFDKPTFESSPDVASTSLTDKEQRDIERAQLRLFQGEIDATNTIYDQMLNQSRMEGQGRLGSQRAMSARGGLLGSDFGASQKSKVQSFNTDVDRAIQAERSAKIGNIMGTVRSAVTEQLAAKRLAKQGDADALIANLKGQATARQNNISLAAQALLAQGLDPTTMSEEEIGAIAVEIGAQPADINIAYQQLAGQQASASREADLKTRKAEADISKIEADIQEGKLKTIGEGTMLYNTDTREMIKNPKTYKPDSPSGLSIGAGVLNQQAVADVHQTLNESRGSDKYASTETYFNEFNGFVASGGDPKDFIKEYDPNIYINPNDPTRSFLQSEMKKTVEQDISEEASRAKLISDYQAVLSTT